MTFFDFIQKNPIYALIGAIVIIVIIIIILVVVVIIQGRPLELPWLKIEGKNGKKKDLEKLEETRHQKQSQSQSIQIYTGPVITQEQLEEVTKRVLTFIQSTQKEKLQTSNSFYQPPELSSKIIYIHTVRYDIRRKLGNIVFNSGGGWAGFSLASLESFLDKSIMFHLIPNELASQINDFNLYIQQYINSGDVLDETFLQIQYMATMISKELDDVIATHPNSNITSDAPI